MASPDEEAKARCLDPLRPVYVRELEPGTSTFTSVPQVAKLDPAMVKHNRQLIDGRRKPATADKNGDVQQGRKTR